MAEFYVERQHWTHWPKVLLMRRRFNEPHLMGNCENCYYATDRSLRQTWIESGKFYDCHRYPMTLEKEHGDYCGEFAWKHNTSLLKEGA